YGYHVGSVDYILKPFHPDLLRSKVEAFAMMHRYYNEKYDLLERMVASRTQEILETNEKLRKSQERFEKMFVSSPCLMAIRRLKDLTSLDVNETWLQFTGYSKEEVIGRNDDFFCISSEGSA